MLVKNISRNELFACIGVDRVVIKPDEIKEVKDNLCKVILQSYRKDDLLILSRALNSDLNLVLEEV